jgi:predicted DNA-binding protein (UPF0251 family)
MRLCKAFTPIVRNSGFSEKMIGTEIMVCLEAIRMTDFQGLDQETAAGLMNVSRQTYGRILAEARAIVAEVLVMGKILRIEGGHFEMPPRGRGRHRRRRGGRF